MNRLVAILEKHLEPRGRDGDGYLGPDHGQAPPLRAFIAVLVAVGLLALYGIAAAAVTAAAATAPHTPVARACSTTFLDGDYRLGPAELETAGRVASILKGYHRLAGLTPTKFIDRYWDPTANRGKGSWRYPPDNGFVIGSDGKPIEHKDMLHRGEKIDRFGKETGGFLAPANTPYSERALPPQSLDVSDPRFECDYHLYRVLKPFDVEEGPIVPGFGQPGHGIQFQLDSSLVPHAPKQLDVLWLIGHKYLARAKDRTPRTASHQPPSVATARPHSTVIRSVLAGVRPRTPASLHTTASSAAGQDEYSFYAFSAPATRVAARIWANSKVARRPARGRIGRALCRHPIGIGGD